MRWNKGAFDRLVLPSQTKELVRALVTVRTSQSGVKQGLGLTGKREDIISGKGSGLIMLLHGGPGTGKTLTAGIKSTWPHCAKLTYISLERYHIKAMISMLNEELKYLHSVAEIAEMPLYRVTCGDIGTNADAVEKYLNNVLYLGKTWNCGKSRIAFSGCS